MPATAVTWTNSGDDITLTGQSEAFPFNFAAGYPPSAGWQAPQWVDIDGDGRADLVMAYQDSGGTVAVQVALSNGDGTFSAMPEVFPWGSPTGMPPAAGWIAPTWSDVNGDGKADLVMAYHDFGGGNRVGVKCRPPALAWVPGFMRQ